METKNERFSEMRQLDTRMQCRDKISIWFGSNSNFYHGLLEVMMNANDEMSAYPQENSPFEMTIALNETRRVISVKDYGRGIPFTQKWNGVPVYETLFETLFAGTNYDNDKSNKVTTGTNGCGLTVLNHTCKRFECISSVDGKIYQITYSDGGLNREIKEWSPKERFLNGTTFIFELDPEIYTSTTYSTEVVKEMCNHLAGSSEGLKINLEIAGEEAIEYSYNNLADYMNKNCAGTIGNQYEFDERIESEEITIAADDPNKHSSGPHMSIGTGNFENNRMKIVWSIGTDPFQETYLNCTYLREGGTIYDGVIEGFRKVLDKYSDKKVKITAADVELGLNFVCGLWTNNVEFANQTKFSTKKQSYKKHIVKYVSDNLEAFRLEEPKTFNDMIKHFTEINNFNKKAEDDIKQLKQKIQKKTKGGLSPKIEGLVDCDMRKSKVEERMLFIDEGKSANHTLIAARDPRIMGMIGLRGRFINSLKTSAANVFKNEEAMAIMAALGCGIELPEKERKRLKGVVEFNEEDLRYSKICIVCDADWAGKAISLSLLCFFYKFYPTLCEQGKVFLIYSPRFLVYDKKGSEYCAYNEAEKNEIVKELGKSFDHIGIVKGLGELNADAFWKYVLSPEIRNKTFFQVDWDAYRPELEELLQTTMGEKIEERKKYIIENVVNTKEVS